MTSRSKQQGKGRSRKRLTAKQRVLAAYPRACAAYVGLSRKIVIRDKAGFGAEISGHYTRERDAWADAARNL